MRTDMLTRFEIRRMRRRMTRSVLDSTIQAALEGPALPKTAARRAAIR